MQYKPPVTSAKRIRRYAATGQTAVLLGDIRAAGMIQYAYLLLVYRQAAEEPVLIVSAEFLAGSHDAVLGVFDDSGHQTLYGEAGVWTDRNTFADKAVAIANERLKITLEEEQMPKPWWKFW